YHCAGQSVPAHVCDPMAEPDPPDPSHDAHAAGTVAGLLEREEQAGHATAGEPVRAPHEVMGRGGHGGMSMPAMVADMRNRFLVAAAFAIPILIWSPIGKDVFDLDPG